ncbi:TonB-dependent receptor [Rudanella paleaurantiibacter]|uniref:TonB-dependent receptor n=2 Tax=Rudanella paleaurantiibacter TaxID=2614655 RepID=A0A7J5TUK2_9BACT|nr:TonB-dependent receptor [Rudanella paleaurantiibacter]
MMNQYLISNRANAYLRPLISLLSLAWFLLPLGVQAQLTPACTGSLSGQILTSAPASAGLPGATIYIRELQRGTLTDTEGRFRLDNLCPGQYTVEYRFLGFTSVTESVRVPVDSVRQITLSNDARNLPGVDVTEHRSEAKQILQTQSELAGIALDQSRGLTLGESLKAIAGLYSIQSGPAISKPVIHGLYSNRILVLNNGIRQEDQQWGSEHAPQVDQFVASRLTVIKGAASIRYGSDAIGGVILVEPKAMPSAPGIHGEANLVGATNGRMGAVSGFLEGAFDRKLTGLSWRAQGTLKRAGNARAPGYFLENTGFQERNFSADLHYDRKHWGAEVYYSQFNNQIGMFRGAQVGSLSDLYAAIARPEPLVQPGFTYTIDRPFQDVQHQLLKGRAYYRSESFGELTLTVASQQNTREEYDRLSFSRVTTPELYLKLNTQTADLIWEHPVKRTPSGGVWSGSVGVNALTQGNVRRYLFLIPNFRANGLGGFIIERYAYNRWIFEGGLRYDVRTLRAFFLNETDDQVFSRSHRWDNANGSFGVSYELRPNLTLTTNLSTAWRAPNASDLYANGLHQSSVAYERGNPNLKAEQAYNGNLALAYTGERLSFDIGIFNNLINNYIYLKPDSVPTIRQRGAFPAYSYDQVRALFRGIDATISYKLSQPLTFTSKTSLLWAYNQTARDYLVLVPPQRSENSIRYEFTDQGRVSGLYVQASLLAVARQHRVPTVSSEMREGTLIFRGDFAPPPPGYVLLGAEAGLTLRLGNQPVQVILTGANLANTVYRDYLNRFRYFADEPGRNLSLKLKVAI